MRGIVLLALLVTGAGCDHGLEPPDAVPVGAVRASITYVGTWPSDSLFDLRFFALPFVPQDTLDLFRDLNQLVFSDRLAYRVDSAVVFVDSIDAQRYLYSGVARQVTRNLLDWRPVGLAPLFQVRPGEVTEVSILVDFNAPPPFPPRQTGKAVESATTMPSERPINTPRRFAAPLSRGDFFGLTHESPLLRGVPSAARRGVSTDGTD